VLINLTLTHIHSKHSTLTRYLHSTRSVDRTTVSIKGFHHPIFYVMESLGSPCPSNILSMKTGDHRLRPMCPSISQSCQATCL
jgi:hypothetical protein